MIKIQFLDINFQFWNIVDITTLASKIDIVLEVESLESYIKHLTSPMIMFEVSNVTKLPQSILLQSLDLRDSIDATIVQCISCFGLSNQCWKYQRFGYSAKNCPCVPTGDGKGLNVSCQQFWNEKVFSLTKSSNLQSKNTNESIEQRHQVTIWLGKDFKASSIMSMSFPTHLVSWPSFVHCGNHLKRFIKC